MRSAFRRTPDGKFKSVNESDYPQLAEISEEDVIALAEQFTPVTEMAAFFEIPTGIFWRRFGNAALRGYMNTRIRLRKSLLQRAEAGESWALNRLATSVLGFAETGFNYEIPADNEEISDEELTEQLTVQLKRAK